MFAVVAFVGTELLDVVDVVVLDVLVEVDTDVVVFVELFVSLLLFARNAVCINDHHVTINEGCSKSVQMTAVLVVIDRGLRRTPRAS